MSGLSYEDGLNFDIYVMDLAESINPQNESDLEELAEDLHERIEMAIQDFIYDSDKFDIKNYNATY